MRTIRDLRQGTVDWYLWRNQGIGASDAPVIKYGKHFQNTIESLWTEKRNSYLNLQNEPKLPSHRAENSAMKRGKELEASVRKLYADLYGFEPIPVCGVHDTFSWMKASFDGIDFQKELIIEIKCPGVRWDGSSDHNTAIEGNVPEKYIPQLDHMCLVSGFTRVHYVSYGDPAKFDPIDVLQIIDYKPSPQQLTTLQKREELFWECVREGVDPRSVLEF